MSSLCFFKGGSSKCGASATHTRTVRVKPGEETTVVGATGATGATRATLGPEETVEGMAENTVKGNRLTGVAMGMATFVGG